MTTPMYLGANPLRRVAWVAALLCSAQAAADLHLHDAVVPDEFCTVCTLVPADLAAAGIDVGVAEPVWTPGTAARPSGVAAVARHFDAERSRAPPTYF